MSSDPEDYYTNNQPLNKPRTPMKITPLGITIQIHQRKITPIEKTIQIGILILNLPDQI